MMKRVEYWIFENGDYVTKRTDVKTAKQVASTMSQVLKPAGRKFDVYRLELLRRYTSGK